MNLSGPQRLALCHGKRGAGTAQVFRPRPVFNDASGIQARSRASLINGSVWSASVCDELLAAENGRVTRRIRILITDGPEFTSQTRFAPRA